MTPITRGINLKSLPWPWSSAFPFAHCPFLPQLIGRVLSQVLSEAKCFVLRAFALTFWAAWSQFHVVGSLWAFRFPFKWKLRELSMSPGSTAGPLSFLAAVLVYFIHSFPPNLQCWHLFLFACFCLYSSWGQRPHFFRSLLHSQCLAQCLAHGKFLIKTHRWDEWKWFFPIPSPLINADREFPMEGKEEIHWQPLVDRNELQSPDRGAEAAPQNTPLSLLSLRILSNGVKVSTANTIKSTDSQTRCHTQFRFFNTFPQSLPNT